MCEGDARWVIGLPALRPLPYRFTGRPEPGSASWFRRRALAHEPHRSDGRPSHTPRGGRSSGPAPGRPPRRRLPRTTVPVSFLALLVLALLTWQVAADGPLRAADEELGEAMRTAAPPAAPPEPLSELLADLGNLAVALPVLALALLWSGLRTRAWVPAGCAALAMALVPLLVSAGKAWLDRPGPLHGTGYFPSGHAATAAVAFGAAALLLLRTLGPSRRRLRVPLLCAAAVLTLANGAGLVWRGYHWPADVLASWCLGWLLLVPAAALARRR
nr:phosphatase PAP2 family protein [Streptomyces sp. HNM0574]